MNVFSVAQYTKPRFKDIQDKQKIAWITGISVSVILNIVLAILCGIWNNDRQILQIDKKSLQNNFNQCQNQLSYCEYSSQRTCNNTVYKIGDKTILFNYSQDVQSSNSNNITDTIEIKDNGDIYINNKEATTETCKDLPQEIYLTKGDNYYTFNTNNFVKETPTGNLQGTINSQYVNQLVLELNNNQIYPIDENVLGDKLYVTNNKYTTINNNSDYSLTVADNKITKDKTQIWPLGNTIYFEANDTWYSVKGPQQVLSYNPVTDGNLNGALEIGGQTNPALTIKGVWGEENSSTSTIYINSVTEQEKIKQTSLLGTGCKVNYLGTCLSPANGTSIMNFYNISYKTTPDGQETNEIQSKKLYMITLPNDKHIQPTNDTIEPSGRNYGGTINIEPGVKVTLSGTYGNNQLTTSGGVINLDQVNIITSNGDTTNAIYYKPITITAKCDIYDDTLQMCINPLPQTIYSQDENGENIYKISLPNNVVYKPQQEIIQGEIILNNNYQLSLTGKFGSNTTTPAISIQTDKLVSSICKLEIDSSCLINKDNKLSNTLYSSFDNYNYQLNLPQSLYLKPQVQDLTGELNFNYNGQITLQSGSFGSSTLTPTIDIKDGVKLLTQECQIMNGTKCIDSSNERYYKYTYIDTQGQSQDEYIKFTFDQDTVQKPTTTALTVNIQNGQINIDGQQFVYNENKQLISINGNYTTKSGLMTISADHNTQSNYGISINKFSSTASVCGISSNQNSLVKSDCYYLWNNTFQIKDENDYVYKVQVNNKHYTQLYPDEYVNEYVNETNTNEPQTNKIRGNITVIAPMSTNNDTFALIQVNGIYDQSNFNQMINNIQLDGNFKTQQYNSASCVNITYGSIMESDYGIYMENANITSRYNNIYISDGSTLTSDYIPILIYDGTTLQSTTGKVGIKVPSLDSITGNNLICKVSTIESPSNQSQCLTLSTPSNISSNKISFKYTKENKNYYYTLQGPQENIYSGNIPANSSTDIISTVQLGYGKDLTIQGIYGDSNLVNNGITITPVDIYGKTNSILINNQTGILHNSININTIIDSSTNGIVIDKNTQFKNCQNGISINGKVNGSYSGIWIAGDVGEKNQNNSKSSLYGIYQESGTIYGSTGFCQTNNGIIQGKNNGMYLNGEIKGIVAGIYQTSGTIQGQTAGIYQSSGTIQGQTGFYQAKNGIIQGDNNGIEIYGNIKSNTSITIDSVATLTASQCKIKNGGTCLLNP